MEFYFYVWTSLKGNEKKNQFTHIKHIVKMLGNLPCREILQKKTVDHRTLLGTFHVKLWFKRWSQ